MKLLKIDNAQGFFRRGDGDFCQIDKISKDELLYLIDSALNQEIHLDPYDENLLKNQAHQIIYKSISDKLTELARRRKEFQDETAQLFQSEYEKYRSLI